MSKLWIVTYTYKSKSDRGVFAAMAHFHSYEQALAFLNALTNLSITETAMLIMVGDEAEIDVRYEKWEA